MINLVDIRDCLDGGIPSLIATCAADGTPNVSALSDVRLVDEGHVALSYQFFNKTRANILSNPLARLHVTDPNSGARYQMLIRYLRTETSGALFAAMEAKLAGIASYSGMTKVFRLLGADIYAVQSIGQLVGEPPRQAGRGRLLRGLRSALPRLRAATELASLLDTMVSTLGDDLGFKHCMLLMADASRERLFTVASRGYAQSGVGSEIALGEGIIGIAALMRIPIRIMHMAQEYLYSNVVREQFMSSNPVLDLERRIPLPGLPESRSQLAVPIIEADSLLGVLFVESPFDGSVTHDDEDACVVLADRFAERYAAIAEQEQQDLDEQALADVVPVEVAGLMTLRHDALDHSVFVEGEYLIKGVAGAILWRMLSDYRDHQRVMFSNRELRRDRGLGLPEIADNLEARLVLLQRRLRERLPALGLERTGRGRYQLRVSSPIRLEEVGG